MANWKNWKLTTKDEVEFYGCMMVSFVIFFLTSFVIDTSMPFRIIYVMGLVLFGYQYYVSWKKLKAEEEQKAMEEKEETAEN